MTNMLYNELQSVDYIRVQPLTKKRSCEYRPCPGIESVVELYFTSDSKMFMELSCL